jgi:hypothetical protein
LSPILVRPVREQLEHDRVIRLLQAKYRRKFDVAINPGREQTTPVHIGASAWYPDLLLQSSDARPKLLGTVEVETAESVNHLEAMSQWGTFSRLRAPLHLYVPVSSVDAARRLCASLKISVAEIWAYNALADEILFTLVHRTAGRKGLTGRQPKAATPARRPSEKRASTGRTKPTRATQSRPARTQRVTTASTPRKAAKTAQKAIRKPVPKATRNAVKKKAVTRSPKKVLKKKVPKKVLKKKVLKKAKATKSARVVRAVKKASKSSRLKKR